MTNRVYEGSGAEDGRYLIVYSEKPERGMGGNGAFVRRKRSGGWEGTERLYGAVREKAIDFLKILYRLSENTL